jgi:uncharacterized protein
MATICKPDVSTRRLCLRWDRAVIAAFFFVLATQLFAAEVIPPKPAKYFNDYAGVVSPGTAQRLDNQLTQFERDTSNQVVVAIFPTMQTDSDIADYTRRVAQSWQVGQKETRNGAVLFVFVRDRKMFIQVGYGLEGALPDATAFDITEFHIKPHFRSNDYDAGLSEGVDLICKAIRGEYKGSGRTVAERNRNNGGKFNFFPFLIFFIIMMIVLSRQKRRGYGYSGFGGPYIGGWSGGGGGGGGWSSGGGGFSGGGGSFGGGGAGSGW